MEAKLEFNHTQNQSLKTRESVSMSLSQYGLNANCNVIAIQS